MKHKKYIFGHFQKYKNTFLLPISKMTTIFASKPKRSLKRQFFKTLKSKFLESNYVFFSTFQVILEKMVNLRRTKEAKKFLNRRRVKEKKSKLKVVIIIRWTRNRYQVRLKSRRRKKSIMMMVAMKGDFTSFLFIFS